MSGTAVIRAVVAIVHAEPGRHHADDRFRPPTNHINMATNSPISIVNHSDAVVVIESDGQQTTPNTTPLINIS